jgi:hypothetical protein
MKPEYTAELVMGALQAYIEHVGLCEGVSLLSPRHKGCFSEEQWEILMFAEKELDES